MAGPGFKTGAAAAAAAPGSGPTRTRSRPPAAARGPGVSADRVGGLGTDSDMIEETNLNFDSVNQLELKLKLAMPP